MSRHREPNRIGFRRQQPDGLVRAIAEAIADGGWINVVADLDDIADLDPRAVGRPSVFSGRGPAIPMGTFIPAAPGRAGEKAAGREHQLGFEHGSGRHAARRLADAGVAFPAGTRVVQDHPRRGLIVAVPATTNADELARILLQASSQLTAIPLGDRWVAEIYHP